MNRKSFLYIYNADIRLGVESKMASKIHGMSHAHYQAIHRANLMRHQANDNGLLWKMVWFRQMRLTTPLAALQSPMQEVIDK